MLTCERHGPLLRYPVPMLQGLKSHVRHDSGRRWAPMENWCESLGCFEGDTVGRVLLGRVSVCVGGYTRQVVNVRPLHALW